MNSGEHGTKLNQRHLRRHRYELIEYQTIQKDEQKLQNDGSYMYQKYFLLGIQLIW